MSTNEKVVNGVQYHLSKQDYDMLSDYAKKINEILARAKVVENGNVAKTVAAAPATRVVKEELNEASLKRVLGEFYGQVCVYNCETQRLVNDAYNGVKVNWDNDDARNAAKTKQYIEGAFPEFECVAYVNGQTTEKYYPGWGEWTKKKVKFDKNGEYTIANIILRDKATGKLEMYCPGWFGSRYHWIPDNAARNGVCRLPYHVVLSMNFRGRLLAGRRR